MLSSARQSFLHCALLIPICLLNCGFSFESKLRPEGFLLPLTSLFSLTNLLLGSKTLVPREGCMTDLACTLLPQNAPYCEKYQVNTYTSFFYFIFSTTSEASAEVYIRMPFSHGSFYLTWVNSFWLERWTSVTCTDHTSDAIPFLPSCPCQYQGL